MKGKRCIQPCLCEIAHRYVYIYGKSTGTDNTERPSYVVKCTGEAGEGRLRREQLPYFASGWGTIRMLVYPHFLNHLFKVPNVLIGVI